ncbi:endospore germination permease [Paenibacillus sp. 843]|uniref:GerAB/ArcD/ProY family transporter n=1 Tax=Paenibacillus sp. 843 TaxID=3341795 RepID=UPI00372A7DC2
MKQSIRVTELVCYLALFEVGSTTLFFLGAEAKRDAWLAMALAACIGLLLLSMYLMIHRTDPDLDLYDLCKRYFGKVIGYAANFAFAAYFTYEASRNLRDLGELTVLTLLNRTPLAFIMLVAIIVIASTVMYGPRVVFLVSSGLLPIVVLSYIIIYSLLISTGLIKTEMMLPVLEHGFKPVLSAAIPELVSFPFGQTLLFLVFFPLVKKKGKLRKGVMITYIITVICLVMINQVNILVLGPTLAARSTLPLLQVVQLIEIADVFERIDVLFVLVLFLGLGAKMTAFYMGAVVGLTKLTGIPYKICTVLLGVCLYILSFLSPNYPHHLWLGIKVVVTYVTPIFQVALPLMLLFTIWIRQKMEKHHQ